MYKANIYGVCVAVKALNADHAKRKKKEMEAAEKAGISPSTIARFGRLEQQAEQNGIELRLKPLNPSKEKKLSSERKQFIAPVYNASGTQIFAAFWLFQMMDLNGVWFSRCAMVVR